jgi:predicted permease
MPVMQGYGWSVPVVAEGYSADPGQEQRPIADEVSPNLFSTLGVPILAGRDLTSFDSGQVVLINEAFARKYFAGRNPIGLHIGLVDERTAEPDAPNREVIGVVGDMKFKNLRDAAPAQLYLPYLHAEMYTFMTFYLRTRLDPWQLMGAVRQQVRRLDPNVPVLDLRTVDDQISILLTTERVMASLSAAFGVLAASLAVIGLYGVMAYTVSRRTREIGIRMALGALRGDVVSMVMREAVVLVSAGIVIGVPVALLLSGLVRNQLYGLQPNDPTAFGGSALLLAIAAGLAGFIPALRASRVDPISALRQE